LGWLTVSKRDLQRIEVLTEILAGKRTAASAAGVLAASVRQAQRLLSKYRDGGGGALVHKARGRVSNNQLGVGLRDYAVELVRPMIGVMAPVCASDVVVTVNMDRPSKPRAYRWFALSHFTTNCGCLHNHRAWSTPWR
jgi:hypothetical protein